MLSDRSEAFTLQELLLDSEGLLSPFVCLLFHYTF